MAVINQEKDWKLADTWFSQNLVNYYPINNRIKLSKKLNRICLSELKNYYFCLILKRNKMFSKACEYGIRATIFIAQQSMKGRRSNLKEISEAITSPVAFTAKILQLLVRNSIIYSIKGANGGFEMTNHMLHTLNLKQLVHAIDGDESTTSCIVGLSSCSTENPCHLHNKYVTIRNNLATMLEETTFIQLIEMEHFTISNLQI